MRRAWSFGTIAVLTLVLAGTAAAHGGNWKAPAAPPPEPPRTGDPEAPTPGGPTTPLPGPPPKPPPSGGRRGGPDPTARKPVSGRRHYKVAVWEPGTWYVWWDLNADMLLPAWGERVLVGGAVTPGGEGPGAAAPPRPPVDPVEGRLVERYLRSLVDPAAAIAPGLRAAAMIALARSLGDEPPLDWFQAHARDARGSREVRESAVLALGLLRRSAADRQLPVDYVDAARERLLGLHDDRDQPPRVRAFAMFAYGLLADQPYADEAIHRDGRLNTRGLWQRIEMEGETEPRTALLTALGLQPPGGVPSGVREGLRRLTAPRAARALAWSAHDRAHAISAYGRLWPPDALATCTRLLSRSGEHAAVHTAVVITLAARATHLTPEERVEAAQVVRRNLNLSRHWLVRGLGSVTLGSLLGADLRAGSHRVLRETRTLGYLTQQAREGQSVTRPFAALGLGLAAHDVRSSSRQIAVALDEIRGSLIHGLRRGRGADDLRGAFAVGCGLARAEEARGTLTSLLANVDRDPELRGHAALALGQLGSPTPSTLTALRAAVEERISPFVHLQAVQALGLLRAPGTRDALLRQLRLPWTRRPTLAPVAAALGRLRDPAATRALLELARCDEEPLNVRVAAVVALGLTLDPEPRPSRVRLTTHANYPSLTWSLAQVFNIM